MVQALTSFLAVRNPSRPRAHNVRGTRKVCLPFLGLLPNLSLERRTMAEEEVEPVLRSTVGVALGEVYPCSGGVVAVVKNVLELSRIVGQAPQLCFRCLVVGDRSDDRSGGRAGRAGQATTRLGLRTGGGLGLWNSVPFLAVRASPLDPPLEVFGPLLMGDLWMLLAVNTLNFRGILHNYSRSGTWCGQFPLDRAAHP